MIDFRRAIPILIAVIVVGCASGPGSTIGPGPTTAEPRPTATTVDGRFRLDLDLAAASIRSTDGLTGSATLSVTEGGPAPIKAASGGPIAFTFVEVGGTRRLEAGFDAACAPYSLAPGAPIVAPLSKFGAWSQDDPNAEFYQGFFDDPEIHLPAGTWDVNATAWFSEVECGGREHDMTTPPIRIDVRP